MTRRFQFSLRAMLGAMLSFALNIWLFALAVTLFPLVLVSAIGKRVGRPRLGEVVGWCCLPAWLLLIDAALSFLD